MLAFVNPFIVSYIENKLLNQFLKDSSAKTLNQNMLVCKFSFYTADWTVNSVLQIVISEYDMLRFSISPSDLRLTQFPVCRIEQSQLLNFPQSPQIANVTPADCTLTKRVFPSLLKAAPANSLRSKPGVMFLAKSAIFPSGVKMRTKFSGVAPPKP